MINRLFGNLRIPPAAKDRRHPILIMIDRDPVARRAGLRFEFGKFPDGLTLRRPVAAQDRIHPLFIVGAERRYRVISVTSIDQGQRYPVFLTVVSFVFRVFNHVLQPGPDRGRQFRTIVFVVATIEPPIIDQVPAGVLRPTDDGHGQVPLVDVDQTRQEQDRGSRMFRREFVRDLAVTIFRPTVAGHTLEPDPASIHGERFS